MSILDSKPPSSFERNKIFSWGIKIPYELEFSKNKFFFIYKFIYIVQLKV